MASFSHSTWIKKINLCSTSAGVKRMCILLMLCGMFSFRLLLEMERRTMDNYNRKPFNGTITVDVFSIGSTSRWDYVEAQNATWASDKSIIRRFEGISEKHHANFGTCELGFVANKTDMCNSTRKDVRRQPPFTTQRDFFGDATPGWLCAQMRPIIALGDIVAKQYIPNGIIEPPDWLLLVDDDTNYRMNVFKEAVSDLKPSSVHVLTGSTHFKGKIGHGGAGVALSSGAVQRFLTPIHCGPNSLNKKDRYQKYACKTIKKNKAYEMDNFSDGMSIADLMLDIVVNRVPFCWHSDWMTGYFFYKYLLMGKLIPKFPCRKPYICDGNQLDTFDICHTKEQLFCHKQNASMMEADFANMQF